MTVTIVGPGGSVDVHGGPVEVDNDLGNPLRIAGTEVDAPSPSGVALAVIDAEARALLATIATELAGGGGPISGTVALDAPTLAALETISVHVLDGTVDLSPATLAALETVNAVVSGTVALDAATLAALENITVTGSVAVTGSVEITNDVGNPLPVSGTVSTGLAQPLTDAQLRAAAVPVSGTVSTGLAQPLTDTQLRAAPVPVSGTVTANTGLTQPLTDTQLRATPVPVSGTVTANTGLVQPLTDVQLRAAPVIVSGTADPTTPATVVAFLTTVTTAGTRVQLAANAIKAGILQAPSTNAGLIFVGTTNVSGAVFGAELQPGQATGIAIDNTNKVYIDASVNGDKCAFLGSN